jgi:acetyltransferase-like isoleucine patch superfamily enzyme
MNAFLDNAWVGAILSWLNLLGNTWSANRLRAQLLRLAGFRGIHPSASVSKQVQLFYLRDGFTLGEGSFVNVGCFFEGPVRIGRYCEIGSRCVFVTAKHVLPAQNKSLRPLIEQVPIVLEDHVWIGANATLLPGVHIGHGAVIGAGAVVTKNVPPNTVVAGVPARYIRQVYEDQKGSV